MFNELNIRLTDFNPVDYSWPLCFKINLQHTERHGSPTGWLRI